MKKKYSFKTTERERRYPILTALDLTLHHALVTCGLIAAIVLAAKIIQIQSPELTAQAIGAVSRVAGLDVHQG